jgi:hypothetical protein
VVERALALDDDPVRGRICCPIMAQLAGNASRVGKTCIKSKPSSKSRRRPPPSNI